MKLVLVGKKVLMVPKWSKDILNGETKCAIVLPKCIDGCAFCKGVKIARWGKMNKPYIL